MADVFVIECIHGTTVSNSENSSMQPKYIAVCSHKMLPLIAPTRSRKFLKKYLENHFFETKKMMKWMEVNTVCNRNGAAPPLSSLTEPVF